MYAPGTIVIVEDCLGMDDGSASAIQAFGPFKECDLATKRYVAKILNWHHEKHVEVEVETTMGITQFGIWACEIIGPKVMDRAGISAKLVAMMREP